MESGDEFDDEDEEELPFEAADDDEEQGGDDVESVVEEIAHAYQECGGQGDLQQVYEGGDGEDGRLSAA